MSLVAYAASSDEEEEESDEEMMAATRPTVAVTPASKKETTTLLPQTVDHISDDEDDYIPVDATLDPLPAPQSFSLSLPKPKNSTPARPNVDLDTPALTNAFSKLPMPMLRDANAQQVIEEEDDEFLRKKAMPLDAEKPPPPVVANKGPVRISIPSLKDFSDVDKELKDKAHQKTLANSRAPKGSGLLGILPQAKSERNFARIAPAGVSTALPAPRQVTGSTSSTATRATLPAMAKPAFIPDTVKNRRPARNTEGVDGITASLGAAKKPTKKPNTQPAAASAVLACSDSEDDEAADISTSNGGGGGGGDFFSLSAADDVPLPEVSANEINAMVAKKAAKMAATTTKYLEEAASVAAAKAEAERLAQHGEEEMAAAQKRYHDGHLDAAAVQALVGGGSAKRRRRQEAEGIEVLDISAAEVLPDREEWMRTALASSTTYQPTGVLNDEEPAAGTRRKHQITYLAHKAKANEAELQAIWAANRSTRRATQSKYGF